MVTKVLCSFVAEGQHMVRIDCHQVLWAEEELRERKLLGHLNHAYARPVMLVRAQLISQSDACLTAMSNRRTTAIRSMMVKACLLKRLDQQRLDVQLVEPDGLVARQAEAAQPHAQVLQQAALAGQLLDAVAAEQDADVAQREGHQQVLHRLGVQLLHELHVHVVVVRLLQRRMHVSVGQKHCGQA